jgi:hypothetical protein
MKQLLNGPLSFSSAVAPGFVAPLSLLQGTLTTDDQLALFSITANTSETITIQTYSDAGGTINSTLVAARGFAPTAFLLANVGYVLTLANDACGQAEREPATLNCDDLYLQDTLGPDTFTSALAVYDNSPVETFVADRFIRSGNSGFTCQEAGTSGSFCDLTGGIPLPSRILALCFSAGAR